MTKQIFNYKVYPVKVSCKVTLYRGYISNQWGEIVYTTDLYLIESQCESICLDVITSLEESKEYVG